MRGFSLFIHHCKERSWLCRTLQSSVQSFAAQKPKAIPFFCAARFGLLSHYFANCI
ncbi:hypothetical protein EIKCOROL_00214 [Eikenella corrodens ATCC 23834]|uniref:Uncharacterized protein n=1 Tax=Eikenella corrodens ATCC 23834 TaxID=546274 RepID=C0DS92_EIKCO|nr:hypothetical protein EIKCOROL_00214 [Eikenella corrodens ATCC 23834]